MHVGIHFFDSTCHTPLWQYEPVSPSEVGAAVSVLLGLEPPVSLSETGSSKVCFLLIQTI